MLRKVQARSSNLIIGFVVVAAIDGDVELVNIAVLAVHMVDGVAQFSDGGYRIDPIPEEMAGIEIAADSRAGGFADLEHGFDIVDEHARMHFKGDL